MDAYPPLGAVRRTRAHRHSRYRRLHVGGVVMANELRDKAALARYATGFGGLSLECASPINSFGVYGSAFDGLPSNLRQLPTPFRRLLLRRHGCCCVNRREYQQDWNTESGKQTKFACDTGSSSEGCLTGLSLCSRATAAQSQSYTDMVLTRPKRFHVPTLAASASHTTAETTA